jgi:hypothetical protein
MQSFRALLKMISEDERDQFIGFLPEDPNEFIHGIWHRLLLGISSCDNHSEGFHAVIERALHDFWRSLLPERLRAIFDCIDKKFKNFGDNRPKQRWCNAMFESRNDSQARNICILWY